MVNRSFSSTRRINLGEEDKSQNTNAQKSNQEKCNWNPWTVHLPISSIRGPIAMTIAVVAISTVMVSYVMTITITVAIASSP